MTETLRRSPWPWVVIGLLAVVLLIVVALVFRPAQMAGTPPGNTTAARDGTAPPPPGNSAVAGYRETPANQPTTGQPPASTNQPTTGQPAAPANQPDNAAPRYYEAVANVEVEMGEWFMRLNPETVPPGRVSFRIRNVGRVVHGFEIERDDDRDRGRDDDHDDDDYEHRGRRLQPGEMETLSVDLPAGTYKVRCYVGEHDERGMRARLQVRAQ